MGFPTQNTNWKTYVHQNVHSCTTYNSQDMEGIKCPLTEEWIKMWYIHTMEKKTKMK